MVPFIRLEEPQLEDLPTREETASFEAYMHKRVEMSNSIGTHFDGSAYFDRETPDDLAFVFEKALAQWCEENSTLCLVHKKEVVRDAQGNVVEEGYVSIDLMEDGCKRLEREVVERLGRVVREHLERTGGKIGHFPYSGERVLLTFSEENGKKHHVRLDPFNLDPGVRVGALEETAKHNDPVKKQNLKRETIRRTEDKLKNRTLLFVISTAVFLVTFFGTLLINSLTEERNLLLLLAVGNIVTASAAIAPISLVLLIKSKLELRKLREGYNRYEFQTHLVRFGYGSSTYYEGYTRDRFEKEVKQAHKYFRFMQAWTDASGRTKNWIKGNSFYKSIASFIQDGKTYIQ